MPGLSFRLPGFVRVGPICVASISLGGVADAPQAHRVDTALIRAQHLEPHAVKRQLGPWARHLAELFANQPADGR